MIFMQGRKAIYYPVLEAEIAKHGIRKKDIAKRLGISERSFSCKMNGRNDFWLSEVLTIQSIFPEVSTDKLFSRKIV